MSPKRKPAHRKSLVKNEFDVDLTVLGNRQIFLFEEVTQALAKKIIKQLYALDTLNHNPIMLYINSEGGNCACGLAIINAMRTIESPVVTIITGEASSIAAHISVSGNKRVAYADGVWFEHSLDTYFEGNAAKLNNHNDFIKKYKKLLNDNLAPGSQKYYGTDNAGTKGFHALPLPGVGGDLYPEDSINVVSSIPDSAGITDFTISLVNDENVPGYYKYYGTNSVGTRGWRDLSDLPNEIGLGGSPDLDSVGTDYPVLRRCNVNILDGSISDVGILGDDIVLSGDGITADQQLVASKVWNAVWNDIVDFQELDDKLRFGKCYYDSNTGAKICNKRCQKSVIGIASDTFGYALGAGNGKAPIGVTGWVLAFVDKEYERGTPLTNDKVGNLTEMTLAEKQMYPERIVAIYKKKEAATTWGLEDKKVQVNGRHWVKIK